MTTPSRSSPPRRLLAWAARHRVIAGVAAPFVLLLAYSVLAVIFPALAPAQHHGTTAITQAAAPSSSPPLVSSPSPTLPSPSLSSPTPAAASSAVPAPAPTSVSPTPTPAAPPSSASPSPTRAAPTSAAYTPPDGKTEARDGCTLVRTKILPTAQEAADQGNPGKLDALISAATATSPWNVATLELSRADVDSPDAGYSTLSSDSDNMTNAGAQVDPSTGDHDVSQVLKAVSAENDECTRLGFS